VATATKYTRTPYLIVQHEPRQSKEVYGAVGDSIVLQAQLLRGEQPSSTVIVAMHPIGAPGYLPMFSGLARAGHHVIACATRYSNGDAALIMESVLVDLGACVRDAKERLGYEKVVLAGWSGGGSIMAGYQAEAEKPVITRTAAGDYTPLADTSLVAADAVMLLAAHRSRHQLLTGYLDPSVVDETDPTRRDPAFDLYGPAAASAPYDRTWLAAYRDEQVARNRRISAWAKEQLAAIRASAQPDNDRCFVVYGTMADPRWLDLTIDPNDRALGSYLGDPALVNDGPVGLARFCTTRSWLSQWSLDDAQVDAVDAAPRISKPVLVVENSADDACPTSHTQAMFDAVGHDDKEFYRVRGANHYYSGQKEHLADALACVDGWLAGHNLT
jgi:alpha-beta hydrolase superfamily lysophospholipase